MEKKIGYYLRTSHYLQNIATQIDRIEPGWQNYDENGASGGGRFTERKSGMS
jgi:hypothetical protein